MKENIDDDDDERTKWNENESISTRLKMKEQNHNVSNRRQTHTHTRKNEKKKKRKETIVEKRRGKRTIAETFFSFLVSRLFSSLVFLFCTSTVLSHRFSSLLTSISFWEVDSTPDGSVDSLGLTSLFSFLIYLSCCFASDFSRLVSLTFIWNNNQSMWVNDPGWDKIEFYDNLWHDLFDSENSFHLDAFVYEKRISRRFIDVRVCISPWLSRFASSSDAQWHSAAVAVCYWFASFVD